MRRILFFIIIASLAQLFYGQERYIIRGEFPDHSLDNEYVFLYELSALPGESERSKQAFIDTVLIVDKTFHYEGTINRKPFLASASCSKGRHLKYRTTFVVEPGDIQIRVTDWENEGNVSGTPINDDYNKYIIERGKQVDRRNSLRAKREETTKSGIQTKEDKQISFSDAYTFAKEDKLAFLEKYAQYPDVVRYWLSFYLNGQKASKDSDFSRFLHVLDLMPKADRDILLAWRDYTIKKEEYREKTKLLLDSINNNAPRFIETIPSSSSSTKMEE